MSRYCALCEVGQMLARAGGWLIMLDLIHDT